MAETETITEDIPHGWRRFVYATNPRDIGTMFLVFAVAAAAFGGIAAFRPRAELIAPGLQYFAAARGFAAAVGTHGMAMAFFTALPAFLGFAYWLVPLMIGSPSVAFPRLGNFSFWLLPFAFALFLLSLRGTGAAAGWQLFPPLSVAASPGPAVDFAVAALLLAALSLLMSAVDLIVTVLDMRAPGMTLSKMPLFAWAVLVAAFLFLVAVPALTGALMMLVSDRHFGTVFFNGAYGGDPLLFRALFWGFAHAAGWALLAVAVGMVGHVVSAFSGRPVFGRLGVAYAMIAAALFALVGWGPHFAEAGLSPSMQAFFMIAAFAVLVPAAAMVFSLVATMWGGAIVFRAPMLWAVGFLPVFAAGALSGLMLAAPGTGTLLRGTMYEAAYFHYQFALPLLFAAFAGFYFWFPKFSGRMYSEFLAKLHFWLTFVGVNLAFFPFYLLGLAGMPGGVADLPAAFADWNAVAGIGAGLVAVSVLPFLAVLVHAFWRGRPAGGNPWGKGARGLEWTLPSPPPYRTFDELPSIR
jgi:cytochrome c oxidase subunit 1